MLNVRLHIIRLFSKRFRYKNVSQSDLNEFINELLFNSPDWANFLIFLPDLKEIFGFRRAQGTVFQLHFPISLKARLYYEEIKTLLKKQGIDSDIEDRVYGKKTRRFLLIDIQQNVEVAYEIIRVVLQELFSLKADSRVEVYYTIDSPSLKKFKSK